MHINKKILLIALSLSFNGISIGMKPQPFVESHNQRLIRMQEKILLEYGSKEVMKKNPQEIAKHITAYAHSRNGEHLLTLIYWLSEKRKTITEDSDWQDLITQIKNNIKYPEPETEWKQTTLIKETVEALGNDENYSNPLLNIYTQLNGYAEGLRF